MRKLRVTVAIACVVLTTGCAQVPQAAIDVNRQVSSGIVTIGENGQEMINAWEETGYMVLDERWSQIYRRAESEYRTKRLIPSGNALTPQQQEDVAGVATLVRDEARKKIRDEANSMRKIISANIKITLDANESIASLLISANSVLYTQQAVAKQVAGLVPIPSSVSKFVSEAIKQSR